MKKIILAILNEAEKNNGRFSRKLYQRGVIYSNNHPMWAALNPELASVWAEIQAAAAA